MRLYLTVRRHALPETSIVWKVESESSTISNLLEQVNDAIPIESGDWGFEDYAVELKGTNGATFECLHYQPIGKVLKENDEVIIRPLLTQDIKIRRISGRIQISSDGRHLMDGLPFGRPLLRRPDRPTVKIPPLKRRRITYAEDDDISDGDEDKELPIPKRHATISGAESNVEENLERQLVIHANFEDEDSEEDEDFIGGSDEESDQSASDPDYSDGANDESDELDTQLQPLEDTVDSELVTKNEKQIASENVQGSEDGLDEPMKKELRNVADPILRTKIRKLHSAYPASPFGVCKHILRKCGGDIEEAFDAMAIGFVPVKPKSAITESSQRGITVAKTRAKVKPSDHQSLDSGVNIEDEAEEHSSADEDDEASNSVINRFDHGGFPPGSIASGKVLSVMADVVNGSPNSALPVSKSSAKNTKSNRNNKKIPKSSNALTSTPSIDRDTEIDISSSDESTSSSDSSDSDEEPEELSSRSKPNVTEKQPSETSSSGSDSDSESESESESDSESSSEDSTDSDKGTGETSRGSRSAVHTESHQSKSSPKPPPTKVVKPGAGKVATKKRNERRRNHNLLERWQTNGILPAGSNITDLHALKAKLQLVPDATSAAAEVDLDDNRVADTSSGHGVDPEPTSDTGEGGAALEPVQSTALSKAAKVAMAKAQELKARQEQLIASLNSAGGIEIGEGLTSQEKTTRKTRKSAVAKESVMSGSVSSDEIQKKQEVLQLPQTDDADKGHPLGSMKIGSSSTSVQANPAASQKVTPAKLTTPSKDGLITSTVSNSRNSRSGISAATRMILSGIGARIPKSQEDKENIRNSLLQNAKPAWTSNRADEVVNEATTEGVDDDYESWREVINYRAVECCHEGIELSEPPFPFVQRWDPQQKFVGRNKKRKARNQPQYNEVPASKKHKNKSGNSKNRWAEEQECFEASYEPSYQEQSMAQDDWVQKTSQMEVDNEAEIDGQLMHDLNEDTSFVVSQLPDDLAPLPSDMSTLLDLVDGEAKVGMTIAYKTLEFSAATRWAPVLSEYKTAIVTQVLDNGELHLTLAQRDREQLQASYNEDGERLYGKFEMPMGEEDEENEADDGNIIVSFSEFQEPKIVAILPEDGTPVTTGDDLQIHKPPDSDDSDNFSQQKDYTTQDETPEAQLSHISETQIQSDDADRQYSQDQGQEEQSLEQQEKLLSEDKKSNPPQGSVLDIPDSDQDAQAHDSAQKDHETRPHGSTSIDLSQGPPVEQRTTETPGLSQSNRAEYHDRVDDGQRQGISTLEPKPATDLEPEVASNQDLDQAVDGVGPRENGSVAVVEAESLKVSVSDEARRNISLLMRDEGGFRSSVPSSLVKIFRPEVAVADSPGDNNIFEKLLKDRAPPSSVSGFDSSSPSKFPQRQSISPSLDSQPVQDSLVSKHQSSWETIATRESSDQDVLENRETTPTPDNKTDADQDDQNWVTISSSPPKKTQRRKSNIAKLTRLIRSKPIGEAQARWEQLQPARHKNNASLGTTVDKPPPITSETKDFESGMRAAGGSPVAFVSRNATRLQSRDNSVISNLGEQFSLLPQMDEDDSYASNVNTEDQYPQSVTSQVSDHGRQPDTMVDDNLGVRDNTSKSSISADDISLHESASNSMDEESFSPPGQTALDESSDENDLLRDSSSDLPVQSLSDASSDDSSDDSEDELPPFEEIMSQRSLNAGKGKKKAANIVAEASSDEGETTPKASKSMPQVKSQIVPSQRQKAQSQAPVEVKEEPDRSQSQQVPKYSSESRGPQRPGNSLNNRQVSSFIDLTQTSDEDDDEPEPNAESEVDDLRVPKRFINPLKDDSDDEDWKESDNEPQKASSQRATRKPNSMNNSLRYSSSQAVKKTKRNPSGR